MKRIKVMLVTAFVVLAFSANNTYSQTAEPLVFDEIVAIRDAANVSIFYLQFTNKSGKAITAFQGALLVADDFGEVEARSDFSVPSSTQYYDAGKRYPEAKTLKDKGGIPSGEAFVWQHYEGDYRFSASSVLNPIFSMDEWNVEKSDVVDFREYYDMEKFKCTVYSVAFADGSVWKRK